MKVYLLQHSYEKVVVEDIKIDEVKIIGIYSSYENAEQVKKEYINKPGFNKFAEDCFYIDEYELNQNNWTEGFFTWNSGE